MYSSLETMGWLNVILCVNHTSATRVLLGHIPQFPRDLMPCSLLNCCNQKSHWLKKAKSTMDLGHWLCPDLCYLMRSKWLLWEDKHTQHQLCSLLPGGQVSAVKYSKGLHIIEWGQAFSVPYSNNWGSLIFLLGDYLLCGSVAWCLSL